MTPGIYCTLSVWEALLWGLPMSWFLRSSQHLYAIGMVICLQMRTLRQLGFEQLCKDLWLGRDRSGCNQAVLISICPLNYCPPVGQFNIYQDPPYAGHHTRCQFYTGTPAHRSCWGRRVWTNSCAWYTEQKCIQDSQVGQRNRWLTLCKVARKERICGCCNTWDASWCTNSCFNKWEESLLQREK